MNYTKKGFKVRQGSHKFGMLTSNSDGSTSLKWFNQCSIPRDEKTGRFIKYKK